VYFYALYFTGSLCNSEILLKVCTINIFTDIHHFILVSIPFYNITRCCTTSQDVVQHHKMLYNITRCCTMKKSDKQFHSTASCDVVFHKHPDMLLFVSSMQLALALNTCINLKVVQLLTVGMEYRLQIALTQYRGLYNRIRSIYSQCTN